MRGAGVLLAATLLLTGCAAAPPISTWVPADCHAATEDFSTFAIELADVPGFKQPIMRDALVAALERRGLERATREDADLLVKLRVTRIDRAPLTEAPPRDPMDGSIPTPAVSRFTAHADVEVFDLRDDRMIYKAGMDRDHALSGDVQLHDVRAEALIAAALDEALAGLGTRCE
ncbi:MAG: hypothetical protein V2J24_18910 [Pseudomonadales bacterium]|jgi:hypothetical protein|nr:hypothetical protein [Pseudomonadales bacterium]